MIVLVQCLRTPAKPICTVTNSGLYHNGPTLTSIICQDCVYNSRQSIEYEKFSFYHSVDTFFMILTNICIVSDN